MMVRDSECAVFVEEDPEKKMRHWTSYLFVIYIYGVSMFACCR